MHSVPGISFTWRCCLRAYCFILFLMQACSAVAQSPVQAYPSSQPPLRSFVPSDMLELKMQIYRYSFVAAPQLDSAMSQAEIDSMVDEVNGIWANAGIRCTIGSVLTRKLDAKDFPPLTGKEGRAEIKERLIAASPRDEGEKVWKVVFIREFPVPAGGLYLPDTRTIYFGELTRGGKTSSVILAHELGHSLKLQHDRQGTNLMNRAAGARSGNMSNAIGLTDEQTASARAQAQKGPAGGTLADAADLGYEQRGVQESVDNARPARERPAVSSERKKRMADRFRTYDYDADGVVRLNDVPQASRAAFRNMDTNRDGNLDEAELSPVRD